MPWLTTFIIGGICGGIIAALINTFDGWPDKDHRNAVFKFFTEHQRLARQIRKARKRLERISELSNEKVYIKNQRHTLAELEQQLSDKAFSKPEEFVDSE